MLNKIAIINCKAKKQNYTCLAEKMYDVSFQFRHQVDFLKEYYKNYLILSSKYGIISPDTIIDPYELTLSKGSRLKNVPKLEGVELQNWILQVKSQLQFLSTQYDQIDLHISNAYLKPLQPILSDKINHIKQPVNPGLVKNRYVEILTQYKKGISIDLNKIGEKRKSKDPEIEKWWYHNEHKPFLGYARHLCKKYPIVDEGNTTRVSRGLNFHTQGWVVNKESLYSLYKTDKGQWRTKSKK